MIKTLHSIHTFKYNVLYHFMCHISQLTVLLFIIYRVDITGVFSEMGNNIPNYYYNIYNMPVIRFIAMLIIIYSCVFLGNSQ